MESPRADESARPPQAAPPRPLRRPPGRIESRLTAATVVLLVVSSVFGEASMLWQSTVLGAGPSGAPGGVAAATATTDGSNPEPAEPGTDAPTPAGSPRGSGRDPDATPGGTPAPGNTPRVSARGSAGPSVAPTPTGAPATPLAIRPPRITGDYLLMSAARLSSLPTTGSAWTAMLAVADGSLGAPDLTDQDNKHAARTLAVGLAYARTGQPAYREKARAAVLSAIGTERLGADNSVLALGRQLAAYVLTADLIALDGADDQRFREWLSGIRTRILGGHGRWVGLAATHADSMNNWGAFAGAARIAASLYLGDAADVAQAATVTRGFLGDRSAWASWQPLTADSATWACDPSAPSPINPDCTLGGIDLGGAILADVSRGGPLAWPPASPGVPYTLESLQGLVLQVELLSRNGYPDAWTWSGAALRRTAVFVDRAAADGDDGWNDWSVNRHLPWLLNARYGLGLPIQPAGFGRTFGFTDWLYGSG
jgi:hypothetical protein